MEFATVAMALVLGGGVITTFISGKTNQQSSMYKKAEEVIKTKKALEDSANQKELKK